MSSKCDSCPSGATCQSKGACDEIQIEYNPKNHVKRVIAVVSGKGGVGKSTVSVLLARELKRRGYSVGILDADITGPSVPRLLDTVGEMAEMEGNEIIPVMSNDGIKSMSLNYFLAEETQPVIWRGPLISGAVKQFWTDVIWGEIDFLVVDLPPGTGDVMLTVMQQMPIDGAVVVSLPQKMVSVIVDKAIKMLHTLQKKVYGVVENMAYTICPRCGEKTELFDGEEAINMVKEEGVDIIAEYPLCSDLMNVSNSQELSAEIAAQTAKMADAVCEGMEING